MNNLTRYITEKLKINKNSKINKDNIFELYSNKFELRKDFRKYVEKINEFDTQTISFIYGYIDYTSNIYLYKIYNDDNENKDKINNALIEHRNDVMKRNFEGSDILDAKGFKGKYSKTTILIDNKTKYREIFVRSDDQKIMYLILQN